VVEFLEPAGRIGVKDGFARVRYAGTGFLMIRRTVLERMQAHYPELQYRREHQAHDPLRDSPHRFALFDCLIDRTSGAYLSEDFSFCQRWTAMGGEIWADLSSKLSHTGPLTFQGDVAPSSGRRHDATFPPGGADPGARPCRLLAGRPIEFVVHQSTVVADAGKPTERRIEILEVRASPRRCAPPCGAQQGPG